VREDKGWSCPRAVWTEIWDAEAEAEAEAGQGGDLKKLGRQDVALAIYCSTNLGG
jgi:hypothetical protein